MRTIATNRWDQSLIVDDVDAALAVEFVFAYAVLLITLLAYVINYIFLSRLPLGILRLYFVEPYFALGARVSFLSPDLNTFGAVAMLASVQNGQILCLLRKLPANCTFVVLVTFLAFFAPPIASKFIVNSISYLVLFGIT